MDTQTGPAEKASCQPHGTRGHSKMLVSPLSQSPVCAGFPDESLTAMDIVKRKVGIGLELQSLILQSSS